MNVRFVLNGKNVDIDTIPERRLSEILREDFSLQGTKGNCYSGECGSCAVIFNGDIAPSCLIPAFAVRQAEVTTIEGISKSQMIKDIKKGFAESNYKACGYCVSGKMIAIYSLLHNNPAPVRIEIEEALKGHSCPCSSFRSLIEAVSHIIVSRRPDRSGSRT